MVLLMRISMPCCEPSADGSCYLGSFWKVACLGQSHTRCSYAVC